MSLNDIEDRHGISWHEAPLPRRWHFCSAWTRGWTGKFGLTYVERCACGAIRLSKFDPWMEKNSRRNT